MAEIEKRKSEHLSIVGAGLGRQSTRSTGFDGVRFLHNALPETAFDAIDTKTSFFGRSLSAPLMVSAMTGGTPEAERINFAIAEACGELGLALAVGSQRIAIEGRGSGGFGAGLRDRAPRAPILGNLGAVQLRHGIGIGEAQRAVDMLEADALMLHLNPLQEAIQPGGDRDFSDLLSRIEALARALPVPLGVKEVGAGLSLDVGQRLMNAGVTILDVAGVGGTSWARVEAERGDERLRRIAAPFFDWGIPTAEAVVAMASVIRTGVVLIASGGIRHGLDVARAIRLGADLAGQAAGALTAAQDGPEALAAHLSEAVEQLRIAMFCTGSSDLSELRRAPLA